VNEALRALGRRVSNWGRWGLDDERGTVNGAATPSARITASATPAGARRASGSARASRTTEASSGAASMRPAMKSPPTKTTYAT
jgi:hypothetical protein